GKEAASTQSQLVAAKRTPGLITDFFNTIDLKAIAAPDHSCGRPPVPPGHFWQPENSSASAPRGSDSRLLLRTARNNESTLAWP
ncbi:hypothetical protein NKI56_16675, partial [Mesorhizobium sp. M0622]|uniref:hypothetical protein n=1 Tax=Mesorhizobium sp. M0622 TaxID=2956975 RepID=UPI003338248B